MGIMVGGRRWCHKYFVHLQFRYAVLAAGDVPVVGCKTLRMKGQYIFRFACLALLWLALCWLLIRGRGMSAWTLFVIVASGIVVFVPLYKKYIRGNGGK